MMTRVKTARLSLTVSGSLGLPEEQALEEHAHGQDRPETSPGSASGHTQGSEQKTWPNSASISAGPPHTKDFRSLHSPASQTSPTLTSLPPFPQSPDSASKASQDGSKSFFGSLKNSKATVKSQSQEATIRKIPQDKCSHEDFSKIPSRTKSTPDLRSTSLSEPVPDLPDLDAAHQNASVHGSTKPLFHRRPMNQISNLAVSRSTASGSIPSVPGSPTPESQESRKNGRLFHSFMRRNHSNRGEDVSGFAKPPTPTLGKSCEGPFAKPPSRDRSTGRVPSPHTEVDETAVSEKVQPRTTLKDQRSQSFRDGAGGALFTGLRHTKARAAEGIGKAHTRFFKQSKAPAARNSRLVEYFPHYEPKIINLPLIEQTRITRIARRLEDSKDKTEFWMPALPWRCIEYVTSCTENS